MTVDVTIKNAKIVIPHLGTITGGLAVDNGKIVSIASDSNLPKADREIEAKGNYVIPGVIEPHTHLGAYLPFEQDSETETKAAACGGITTLFTFLKIKQLPQPFSKFKYFKDAFVGAKKIIEKYTMVDVAFHFSDPLIEEIPVVAKLGVPSFKFHKGYLGDIAEQLDVTYWDDGELCHAFEKISEIGHPGIAMCHAENAEMITYFKSKVMKEGKLTDLSAWSDTRPPSTEEESIRRVAFLARIMNCPIYFPHVSSKEGIESIIEAKNKGTKVYAEATTHHLSLTRKDKKLGVLGKETPPLRDKKDIDQLWLNIKRGLVSCIGTDHCAIKRKDKMGKGDILSAQVGWPATELLLPIVLSEGVTKRRITLEKLVEVCCYNPARIFGIYPRKGTISVGSDADIVIVDVNKKLRVHPELLHGASDFDVYDGRELKGWPVLTMLRGNIIMENREPVGKRGVGKYLSR